MDLVPTFVLPLVRVKDSSIPSLSYLKRNPNDHLVYQKSMIMNFHLMMMMMKMMMMMMMTMMKNLIWRMKMKKKMMMMMKRSQNLLKNKKRMKKNFLL